MECLQNQTDEQLVVHFSKGNNTAFDILLDRYKTKIHSYISFVVKDSDLAEDLFQETFIKAITTIKQGRYVDSGRLGAWLTRIAHNLIVDYFRQEKSENLVSCDQDEYNILNTSKLCEGTIEDELVQRQIESDVRKLIRSLPDNQQEVLIMRYYKNLSFKEIADTTGVSINTALGRMRYALINMRRMASQHNIVLTVS